MMMKIKKIIKGLFIIIGIFALLIIVYAIINNYRYPVFSDDSLILSSPSPDGKKIAKIYHKKNGATVPNIVMIEICIINDNCKTIYYNKEQNGDFLNYTDSKKSEVNFRWINNDEININDFIININNGIYDFRRIKNNYYLKSDN